MRVGDGYSDAEWPKSEEHNVGKRRVDELQSAADAEPSAVAVVAICLRPRWVSGWSSLLILSVAVLVSTCDARVAGRPLLVPELGRRLEVGLLTWRGCGGHRGLVDGERELHAVERRASAVLVGFALTLLLEGALLDDVGRVVAPETRSLQLLDAPNYVYPVATTSPRATALASPTIGPPPPFARTTGRKHAWRAPTVPSRSGREMRSHASASTSTSSTVSGSAAPSPAPQQYTSLSRRA